jgi:hypothetical protein
VIEPQLSYANNRVNSLDTSGDAMTSSSKKPSVTVERRRHDRISAELEAALSVGLVMEDGTVRTAVPVNISTGGVCLRWSPEDMVALNVGQRVELCIEPVISDAPVTVQATVRWTGVDDDGSIRYGLEFEDLYRIFEDVMPALWRLCRVMHGRR